MIEALGVTVDIGNNGKKLIRIYALYVMKDVYFYLFISASNYSNNIIIHSKWKFDKRSF